MFNLSDSVHGVSVIGHSAIDRPAIIMISGKTEPGIPDRICREHAESITEVLFQNLPSGTWDALKRAINAR